MDKEISKKSQMLRLHFATTAKEMILSTGIEDLSVRKIAKEAGYTFGTIYNHFKNLDELLWMTRSLFIDYISKYMDANTVKEVKNSEDVIDLFSAYMNYYIENPNVYAFLYFYSLDIESKNTKSLIETNEYKSEFEKTLQYLSNEKGMEKTQEILKTIIYSIHGLLTLYLSGNDNLTKETIIDEAKSIIENQLN